MLRIIQKQIDNFSSFITSFWYTNKED